MLLPVASTGYRPSACLGPASRRLSRCAPGGPFLGPPGALRTALFAQDTR